MFESKILKPKFWDKTGFNFLSLILLPFSIITNIFSLNILDIITGNNIDTFNNLYGRYIWYQIPVLGELIIFFIFYLYFINYLKQSFKENIW